MMLFGSDIVKQFKLSGEEDDAEDRQRQDRRFENFVEKEKLPLFVRPPLHVITPRFPFPLQTKTTLTPLHKYLTQDSVPEMTIPQTSILGTGMIGLSTAYFLSASPTTPPSSIRLIEPSSILFASASGFAGGYLASDWVASECEELGKLSFRLHRELAEKEGGKGLGGMRGVEV